MTRLLAGIDLGTNTVRVLVAERARLPGLEPGRADVIVPGAVVLAAALAGLGLSETTVSDAGLREGILLAAVGWLPQGARKDE